VPYCLFAVVHHFAEPAAPDDEVARQCGLSPEYLGIDGLFGMTTDLRIRLLQSVALRRSFVSTPAVRKKESKSCLWRWQFDCSYRRDKRNFILRLNSSERSAFSESSVEPSRFCEGHEFTRANQDAHEVALYRLRSYRPSAAKANIMYTFSGTAQPCHSRS
jgi:hypothetical protein